MFEPECYRDMCVAVHGATWAAGGGKLPKPFSTPLVFRRHEAFGGPAWVQAIERLAAPLKLGGAELLPALMKLTSAFTVSAMQVLASFHCPSPETKSNGGGTRHYRECCAVAGICFYASALKTLNLPQCIGGGRRGRRYRGWAPRWCATTSAMKPPCIWCAKGPAR